MSLDNLPDLSSPFGQALDAYQQLTSAPPVPKGELTDLLLHVETVGMQETGGMGLSPDVVAAMHNVFTTVQQLEVQPPFTPDDLSYLGGKFAVYSTLLDVANAPVSTQTAPTPTDALPTDKLKS